MKGKPDMDKDATDIYKVYWDDGNGKYCPTEYSYTRLYSATKRIHLLSERFPEHSKKFKIVHCRTEINSETHRKKKTKAEMYYDLEKSEYPINVR